MKGMDIMSIKTKRLLLREFKTNDAKQFYEISNDENVKEYLSYLYCEFIEDAYEFMEYIYENDEKQGHYIIENKNKQIIGIITYESIFKKEMEFSIVIGDKFRGNAYASEAILGLMEFFKTQNYNLVYKVICSKSNKMSIKMINKLKPKSKILMFDKSFETFIIS